MNKPCQHLSFLGKELTITIDRRLGSLHPEWGFRYPINYGYVPGTFSPDGEELDAYILGITTPVESFSGVCIAIIQRLDDDDDKLIMAPKGMSFSDEEILQATYFQEKYFTSTLLRYNPPMRVLCIDPGEKRLGIAISDPSETLAKPLCIIPHESRKANGEKIISLAEEHQAGKIVIGQSFDIDGLPNTSGKRAGRLASVIRQQTEIPVILWNEYASTKTAQSIRRQMGVSKKQRSGHLDDLAAAIILQSYLDHHHKQGS